MLEISVIDMNIKIPYIYLKYAIRLNITSIGAAPPLQKKKEKTHY